MLANLAIGHSAPLETFLLGQPQFRNILASRDAEQLRQRVFTCYHLGALDAEEVKSYVEHRLQIASWSGNPSFSEDSFAAIYRHTGGIPRKINLLCSRLLLSAFLEKRNSITLEDTEAVATEWNNELEAIAVRKVPRAAAPVIDGTPSDRIESLERRVARHDHLLKLSLDVMSRLGEPLE